MKLIKMKALTVGTIVADAVSPLGEINTGCIIHVDPDSKLEDGRYSDPLVTEDAADKLEAGGFAKRTGEVDFKPGVPLSALGTVSVLDASVEASRVEEFAEHGETAPGFGVSGIDTRESVNFPDRAVVSGGVDGVLGEGIDAEDPDAAPGGEEGEPKPVKAPKVAK